MWISVSCWNSKNKHVTCKGTLVLWGAGWFWIEQDWRNSCILPYCWFSTLGHHRLCLFSVLVIGMAYSTLCMLSGSHMPNTGDSSPSHRIVDKMFTILSFALLMSHMNQLSMFQCISSWKEFTEIQNECYSHKSICKIVLRWNFLKMASGHGSKCLKAWMMSWKQRQNYHHIYLSTYIYHMDFRPQMI